MTDHTTPTDDDLSLALDGEASPELLARIAASPEAQARLDQLRAAADRVAGSTVPPLDAGTVDGLISTALDTPIAPSRGASTGRGPAPWLVAAAVILLMAVGLTLVWAGRGSEDDQASARFDSVGQSISSAESSGSDQADSSFSESAGKSGTAESTGEQTASPAGGHGSATTVVADSGASDLPLVFLGTYPSGNRLRAATASSWADAVEDSDSPLTYSGSTTTPDGGAGRRGMVPAPPADESVDRCAQQLQVTLSLEDGPVQTGYATVEDDEVLVYEFATTSARDGKETTLVAAVGVDACNEVVIFER